MGPFLPNCIFEGFFSLVHASLKIHLFYKALYLKVGTMRALSKEDLKLSSKVFYL